MKSIHSSLIWPLMVITSLIYLLLGGVVFYFVLNQSLKSFDAALHTRAQQIAGMDPSETMMERISHWEYYVMVDDRDNVLMESGSMPRVKWEEVALGPFDSAEAIKRSFAKIELPADGYKLWDFPGKIFVGGVRILLFYRGVTLRKETPEGFVKIFLVRSADDLEKLLWSVLIAIGSACLVAILLTIGLIYLLMKRSMKPLNLMGAQCAALKADHLSHRFPEENFPSELKPIAQSLNRLIQRMDQALKREKRFTADLSHELRTPVAELKALSQVGLKQGDGALREYCEDSLSITTKMESLITALLNLRACETGKMVINKETVDLKKLIENKASFFAKEQKTFELSLPDEMLLETDPILMDAILTNLCSNAMRHGPEKGIIQIHGDSQNRITIGNQCSDLNSEDLKHLVEPLWQKEESRTSVASMGLGLALTQAYCHALGLSLDFSLSDRWFQVRIS